MCRGSSARSPTSNPNINTQNPHTPSTHTTNNNKGITKAVGKALGVEPKVVLYSPEEVGTGKGGKAEGFPFR